MVGQSMYLWIGFCYFVVLKEFKEILRKQATVEAFTEWLDGVVEQKVVKVYLYDIAILVKWYGAEIFKYESIVVVKKVCLLLMLWWW